MRRTSRARLEVSSPASGRLRQAGAASGLAIVLAVVSACGNEPRDETAPAVAGGTPAARGNEAAEPVSMLWWCNARPGNRFIDLFRGVENDDASGFVPNPSVLAFRRELLKRWPDLGKVMTPASEKDADTASRFVELDLPPDAPVLPRIDTLANAHGLRTLPAELDKPASKGERNCTIIDPLPAPGEREITGPWTQAHIVGLGASPRWVALAWSTAGLPAQATFGQAVGAFILALALRDGAKVTGSEARAAVEEVAQLCSKGVPTGGAMVRIDFAVTEVSGFAGTVADGGY